MYPCGMEAMISLALSTHSGPRKDSSLDPSPARCERMAALARISLAASFLPICSESRTLDMNGAPMRPSGVEMSTNSPGSLPVATNSFILRMRFPVRLSRTVPRDTTTSVAMNASGGTPMSNTMRL